MRAMPLLPDAAHTAAELSAISSNANQGGRQPNSSGRPESDFGEILSNVTTGSNAAPSAPADTGQSSWRSGLATNLPPLRPFAAGDEEMPPKPNSPPNLPTDGHGGSKVAPQESAPADGSADSNADADPSSVRDGDALWAQLDDKDIDQGSASSTAARSLYRLSVEVAAAARQALPDQATSGVPTGSKPPPPRPANPFTSGTGAPFGPGGNVSSLPSVGNLAALIGEGGKGAPSDHERSKIDGKSASDESSASARNVTADVQAAVTSLPAAAFAPVAAFAFSSPNPHRDAAAEARSSLDAIAGGAADPFADNGGSAGANASRSDGKPNVPIGTAVALTQMNAKVTSQETHLPPVLPLSPTYQIADAIVTEASALVAASGGPAAPSGDPIALPTTSIAKVMTLNLEPPELGKVEITMRLNSGGLDVSIDVASGETLQRLHADEDKLADALGTSGYDLSNLTIRAAVHDLSANAAQGGNAAGQNPSSSPAPQSDQSGSMSDRGRSGQDSFAERNQNDSTGNRQGQNRNGPVVFGGDDGLYV